MLKSLRRDDETREVAGGVVGRAPSSPLECAPAGKLSLHYCRPTAPASARWRRRVRRAANTGQGRPRWRGAQAGWQLKTWLVHSRGTGSDVVRWVRKSEPHVRIARDFRYRVRIRCQPVLIRERS